ncbi:MAG: hypothetical protein IJZ08_07530 [Clostridia bacterium]|nr:hypothetical protein [Clostridia bacterium]
MNIFLRFYEKTSDKLKQNTRFKPLGTSRAANGMLASATGEFQYGLAVRALAVHGRTAIAHTVILQLHPHPNRIPQLEKPLILQTAARTVAGKHTKDHKNEQRRGYQRKNQPMREDIHNIQKNIQDK